MIGFPQIVLIAEVDAVSYMFLYINGSSTILCECGEFSRLLFSLISFLHSFLFFFMRVSLASFLGFLLFLIFFLLCFSGLVCVCDREGESI